MTTVSTNPAVSGRFNPFVLRNFGLLWSAQAISTLGDKFTEIAIPVMVYTITGSALQLGLAFISQTVASLVFGLLAGALTDRSDKRRAMIGMDLVRAAVALLISTLPAWTIATGAKIGTLYLLAFAAAAAKQFFLPARISLVPRTVPADRLMAANSLDQAAMTLAEFTGYAMAGALVQAAGFRLAFWIDALTFLLSAACVGMIVLPKEDTPAEPAARQSIVDDVKAGLRQVSATPVLRAAVILSAVAPAALGATAPLEIVFSHRVLHMDNLGFSLIQAASVLGLSLGVLLVARIARGRRREHLLAGGVVGMGLGRLASYGLPILLGALWVANGATLLGVALPFFFLTGAAHGAVFLGIRTVVQETSPRDMIGRVFSVIQVVSSGALALGASLTWVADTAGLGPALLLPSAFLTLVGTVALWQTSRRPRPEM